MNIMRVFWRIYFFLLGIYLLVAVFLLGTYGASHLYSIQLIGDRDIYVNIGSNYFENGYRASFLKKSVSNVEVTDNIDCKKVGKYQVDYRIPFFMYDIHEKRNVYVVDKENPEITLDGDSYIYLSLHEEYVEQGYQAKDNVDGDLTSKVEVHSTIDINKVGTYQIQYKVLDSSSNEATASRTVEVIDAGLLTDDVYHFRLKGSFKDVILEYEETEYPYFSDISFIGDSNVLFLHTKGYFVDGMHTWARLNMNIGQINSSTFTEYGGKNTVDIRSAIEMYHPKYLILTVGINTALYMDKETMIEEVDRFILFMKENYPDVRFAFSSIFPVRENGTIYGPFAMKKINEYNYYIVNECHKYHVNFINFSDEIKNSEGYGDDEYLYCEASNDCGFHLSMSAKEKFVDYIKHLNLERNYQK